MDLTRINYGVNWGLIKDRATTKAVARACFFAFSARAASGIDCRPTSLRSNALNCRKLNVLIPKKFLFFFAFAAQEWTDRARKEERHRGTGGPRHRSTEAPCGSGSIFRCSSSSSLSGQFASRSHLDLISFLGLARMIASAEFSSDWQVGDSLGKTNCLLEFMHFGHMTRSIFAISYQLRGKKKLFSGWYYFSIFFFPISSRKFGSDFLDT